MGKGLRLGPGLTLPLEFATEGVAVIGMRGSGKSNTEVRFAELLDGAGVPFCAVDPKGDWHGIRSAADGKSPGLQVPVFGGLHGDFPLEPAMGARIADLLVDEMLSAVLDVSGLSKTGGLPTFLTAFCNRLMHRHQLEPHVRTVILEEAHRYIPQEVRGPTAALKEAAAALLLEGRAFGLGCWAATQRPARLHKDVLEEVGTAIIHRIGVSATNDMRTITGWVKHYDLSTEIVASLTSLAPGEAWVLIPESGIVQRVQVDRRQTFDSAATPKVGAARRAPTNVADIDAAAIIKALEDVVERAKADDPAELRKRIRELERQGEKVREVQVPVVEYERVELAPEWLLPMLGEALDELDEIKSAVDAEIAKARQLVKRVADRVIDDPLVLLPGTENGSARTSGSGPARATGSTARKPVAAPPAVRSRPSDEGTKRVSPQVTAAPTGSDARLGSGARKVLLILAHHPDGLSKRRLCALAGYSPKKSTVRNHLSELRVAGFVGPGEPIVPTAAGLEHVADDVEPLPTGQELLEHWQREVGGGAVRALLDVLIEHYPENIDSATAAEQTGIEAGTSTIRNAISKLRTLGIARKEGFRADDAFMEAIRG